MTCVRIQATSFLKTDILKCICKYLGLAITGNMHSATKQKEKNKKNKALKLLILGSCTNHYSTVPWFPQTKNSLLIKYL